MKKIIFLILLTINALTAEPTFNNRYSLGLDAFGFTWDSKHIVTKFDSAGQFQWHQVYGSPSYDYREEWPVLKNINRQIIMTSQYWKWIWAKTSNYEMQHQFWRLDSLGAAERTYTTPLLKPGTTIPWKMYPSF